MPLQETAVAFEAKTALPFADTVERCRQALAKEGFGEVGAALRRVVQEVTS